MIFPGLSFRDYAALDAVNWSRLKAMRVSPLQFFHELTNPQSFDAAHFRVGHATHCLVLEPDSFKERYTRFDGTRRGKAWTAAKSHAEAGGLTILSEEEATAAFGASASVLTNPHAKAILSEGLREVSLTWEDPETGLTCKARIDFAGDRMVDLKTAARIEPRAFRSAATRLGYHGQFAFYVDGLQANGIATAKEPVMIVVQSAMPHDCIVYLMPPHVIEAGRQEYRRLLRKLVECAETETWPGIAKGPVVFELPPYAYSNDPELEPAALEEEIA